MPGMVLPADVSRPPPPAPLLAWGMRGLPGSGTQPPSSPQFPPHTQAFYPHVQETPASLGLEFSADHALGLNPWACRGPEQCSEAVLYCVSAGLWCSTAPSPFAVLFALMGRQVSVPWTDAVGGAWSCVWAGGRSGHTSCCLSGRGNLFSSGLSLYPQCLCGLDGRT